MPSISFFPYASIMAVSISRLALGWCCAVFLSRHMSSMPVTITLLILSASSWAFSAGMSKDASSAAKDRGNHPAHVVRAPGCVLSGPVLRSRARCVLSTKSELYVCVCVSKYTCAYKSPPQTMLRDERIGCKNN